MSKAKPVERRPQKASSDFDIFFYGIDKLDPEITEVLEQEITFPEKGVGSVKNVHMWSLSRIPAIETIMASFGYFESHVDFFVDVRSSPQIIYYNIQPGPLYTLGAFSLKSDPPHHGPVTILKNNLKKFGIKLGMPANKYALQDSKKAILEHLGAAGHPFAVIVGERIVTNRTKKTMLVSFKIRANKLVRYGDVILEGGGVTGEFLKPFLNWNKGDIFNKSAVDETAQLLMNTGIFKSVTIRLCEEGQTMADLTPEEVANESDAPVVMVDIHCHLVPKKATMVQMQGALNSFGGGFGFEGLRHNRLQSGETFYLDCFFGSTHNYISPGFLLTDIFYVIGLQSLSTLNIMVDRFPGFTSARANIRQAFDFAATKNVGISLGVAAEYYTYPEFYPRAQKELSGGAIEVFAGVVGNFLDEPARPTRGWLLKILGTGSIGALGDYRSSQIKARFEHFTPIGKRSRITWKNWIDLSSTPTHFSTDSDPVYFDIPPHKLMFLGGPGGLRGFGRQPFAYVPENFEMQPHYSSILFGTQVNYNINKNLSIGAFLDVGETFETHFPTITWPMHYAIGGSAEFYTRFGAFNFTIAAPMREEEFTHPFEFSISFKPLLALE